MAPRSGTHPPSQDLLLPTGDPVEKLLGQWSGKDVLMDQVVLRPATAFRDTSGPLRTCGLDSPPKPPHWKGAQRPRADLPPARVLLPATLGGSLRSDTTAARTTRTPAILTAPGPSPHTGPAILHALSMTGHKSPSHHHGLCRELHTAESEMLATSPHTSGVTGSTCPLQGASPCVSQDFLGDRHSGGSGCAPVLRHLSPCQSRAEPDPEGREKTPPWASRLLPAPLLEFSASVTVHPSPCPLPVPSAFFTYQLKQAIHVLPVRGAHSQRNSPCDLSLSPPLSKSGCPRHGQCPH